jgi:hypothetical protein
MTNSFGARGLAPEAFYFLDPDNSVIEARHCEYRTLCTAIRTSSRARAKEISAA